MDDETYIGLIDTHAEGVSGHHHAYLVLLPGLLTLVFHCGIQSGMIEGGGDSCLGKHIGEFLRASAATGIDDGRSLKTTEDVDELLALVIGMAHNVSEVLSLEAHAEDVEPRIPVFHRKLFTYILHHGGSGSGGEGEDGRIRNNLPDFRNLQI